MAVESLHFPVNGRTTADKGISLPLKRNIIAMITTRIQIESYLAEYVRGKYYDETIGTVRFPSSVSYTHLFGRRTGTANRERTEKWSVPDCTGVWNGSLQR